MTLGRVRTVRVRVRDKVFGGSVAMEGFRSTCNDLIHVVTEKRECHRRGFDSRCHGERETPAMKIQKLKSQKEFEGFARN